MVWSRDGVRVGAISLPSPSPEKSKHGNSEPVAVFAGFYLALQCSLTLFWERGEGSSSMLLC